ncbi:hypothetical protein PoB_007267400 [Plakobranchus ocellatus]|uniref:Uncharacterized protein n=1 Tax=Plakobranchus ocellatus TaxID=259542 RepID=A0AAV4DQ95_9GAST|nr:hypothetical protein PoB_007267400 [Plakobranchus ocellatus]
MAQPQQSDPKLLGLLSGQVIWGGLQLKLSVVGSKEGPSRSRGLFPIHCATDAPLDRRAPKISGLVPYPLCYRCPSRQKGPSRSRGLFPIHCATDAPLDRRVSDGSLIFSRRVRLVLRHQRHPSFVKTMNSLLFRSINQNLSRCRFETLSTKGKSALTMLCENVLFGFQRISLSELTTPSNGFD